MSGKYFFPRETPFDERYVVAEVTGCWEWRSARDRHGYGRCTFEGRTCLAHRVSYLRHVGPIPEGLELDHLCRNPSCVNPAHLEPVTRRENILRSSNQTAENARKTHCHRGHPFDEANTYVVRSTGKRECRACRREAERRRRERLQVAA